LQELESVVTRARHFQFKPDGEVTFMMAQDAVGLPAPVMQVCKSYFQSQNVYFSSETLFEM